MSQGPVDSTKPSAEEPSQWPTVLAQNIIGDRREGRKKEAGSSLTIVIWEKARKDSGM